VCLPYALDLLSREFAGSDAGTRFFAALPAKAANIISKNGRYGLRQSSAEACSLMAFIPSPGFNCIVTALKSRTLALKTPDNAIKFVRDLNAKKHTNGRLRARLPGAWRSTGNL
jgi:hypothetical protein